MNVIEGLYSEYRQLVDKVQNLENQLVTLHQQIAELQQSLSTKGQQISEYQATVSAQEEKIQELERMLSIKTQQLSETDEFGDKVADLQTSTVQILEKSMEVPGVLPEENVQIIHDLGAAIPVAASIDSDGPISRFIIEDAFEEDGFDRDLELLETSQLFDSAWYLQQYPDVAKSGMDPALHFLIYGAAEQRSPGSDFDTAWYLQQNPDVASSDINPLIHYLQYGKAEGRLPRAS